MFIYICTMRLRDEQKEQLVRTKALELLVEEGFNGFSMHKLAKAANVSPATLYIYFQNKEDLIVQLGIEVGLKIHVVTFEGFDYEASFEDGLWMQWKNRAKYVLENPISAAFIEQFRNSPYKKKLGDEYFQEFRNNMTKFLKRAIEKGELIPLPKEVFWTLAFAPLYQLIHFAQDGYNMAGEPFVLTEEIMRMTFNQVIKSLKP